MFPLEEEKGEKKSMEFISSCCVRGGHRGQGKESHESRNNLRRFNQVKIVTCVSSHFFLFLIGYTRNTNHSRN